MRENIKGTVLSLSINLIFALFNFVIGFVTYTWWYITLGAYYFVLSVARFSVVLIKRRSNGDIALEQFAKRLIGILLLVMSFCLVGIIMLTAIDGRGADLHEIVMISVASFSFYKITVAIIGLIRSKSSGSPAIKTLRNIAFSDALVSIYSLQRSMLVSFEGMAEKDIFLMNILTGTAVFITVLLLSVNLIGGRYVDMAKSKLIKANEKIAEAVVGGYKKIENAAVKGYEKVEDKFVEAYLTKDGETVEEAKARLKNK